MSASYEFSPLIAASLRSFGCMLALPVGDALTTVPRFFLSVGVGYLVWQRGVPSEDVGAIGFLFEFMIGFLIGAPLRAIADVSEMVGELIDTARGQTIAAVNDPLSGQGASDLAVIAKVGATVIALWFGALEVVLHGISQSFLSIPLGTLSFTAGFAAGVFRCLVHSIGTGLQVAAVWLSAFFIVDVGCAAASRMITGLSFSQLGGIVKMLVTFLIVYQVLSQGFGRIGEAILVRVMSSEAHGITGSQGQGGAPYTLFSQGGR
jgi:flagellar biosynthesis protein FliR